MLHEDCLALGLTPKKIQKIANDDTLRYRYYDSSGSLVHKSCTKCNEILPEDSFSYRKRAVDQLETRCKACFNYNEKTYRDSTPGYMSAKNKRAANRRIGRTPEELARDVKTLRPDGKKTCTSCKDRKYLSEFPKGIYSPDGRGAWCKECDRLDKKTRREIDPTWNVEIRNRCREKYRARSEEEILSDRERLRPDGTKKCKMCKGILNLTEFYRCRTVADGLSDVCIDCIRSYLLWKNKLSIEDYWQNRGIPPMCYVCGSSYDHIDHVIPRNLEGPHDITNLLPLCAYHNTSKGDTPLDQWLYLKHPHDMERVLRTVIFEYGINPFPVA